MENIKLHGRLKAYAKLSVHVNPQPVVGGDDFLKKILTTSKDTLIDLGYKDAISGNEVYAIRRNFDVISLQHSTFTVILGQSVSKVFTCGGCLYEEGVSTDFPIFDRDKNKVSVCVISIYKFYHALLHHFR